MEKNVSNKVNEFNNLVESLKKDVLRKKSTDTSNSKVKFVCGKFDVFSEVSYGSEKEGRNLVEGISKGKGLNPAQLYAYQQLQAAQDEFNRQISYNVNKIFEADIIVTHLIEEMSKTDGAQFFTPDFLRKYGLYKIPCGTILDTLQRCKSFVSSLYTAANKAHQWELKQDDSVDAAVKLCQNRIKEHNNGWLTTKWDALSGLNKARLLAPIIFWNWYPLKGQPIPDNVIHYTHEEQVEILRRLGINVRLKGRKGNKKESLYIEIEEYKVRRYGIDYNLFYEYPVDTKPLSEEDKAKVMSTPISLLPTKEEPIKEEPITKRTTKRKATTK